MASPNKLDFLYGHPAWGRDVAVAEGISAIPTDLESQEKILWIPTQIPLLPLYILISLYPSGSCVPHEHRDLEKGNFSSPSENACWSKPHRPRLEPEKTEHLCATENLSKEQLPLTLIPPPFSFHVNKAYLFLSITYSYPFFLEYYYSCAKDAELKAKIHFVQIQKRWALPQRDWVILGNRMLPK